MLFAFFRKQKCRAAGLLLSAALAGCAAAGGNAPLAQTKAPVAANVAAKLAPKAKAEPAAKVLPEKLAKAAAAHKAGAKARIYSGIGRASWYGGLFQGRRTANGEIFNMHGLTAAHRTMPLPSYARVTNLQNGSSLIVRVNDRGPYAHNRIIDLSQKAAQLLGYNHGGLADVKVDYVGPAPSFSDDEAFLRGSYRPAGGLKSPLPLSPNKVSPPAAKPQSGKEAADKSLAFTDESAHEQKAAKAAFEPRSFADLYASAANSGAGLRFAALLYPQRGQ